MLGFHCNWSGKRPPDFIWLTVACELESKFKKVDGTHVDMLRKGSKRERAFESVTPSKILRVTTALSTPIEEEESVEDEESMLDLARAVSMSLQREAEIARQRGEEKRLPLPPPPTEIDFGTPTRPFSRDVDAPDIESFCNTLHPLAYPHLVEVASNILGPKASEWEKGALCNYLASKYNLNIDQPIKTILDGLPTMSRKQLWAFDKLNLNCPREGCEPRWKATVEDLKSPLVPLRTYVELPTGALVRDWIEIESQGRLDGYYNEPTLQEITEGTIANRAVLDAMIEDKIRVSPEANELRDAFRQRWGEIYPLSEMKQLKIFKPAIFKVTFNVDSVLWWDPPGFEEVAYPYFWTLDFSAIIAQLEKTIRRGNVDWPQTQIVTSEFTTLPSILTADSLQYWNQQGFKLEDKTPISKVLWTREHKSVSQTIIWDSSALMVRGRVTVIVEGIDQIPEQTHWCIFLTNTVQDFLQEYRKVMMVTDKWQYLRNQRFNIIRQYPFAEDLKLTTRVFPNATQKAYFLPKGSTTDLGRDLKRDERVTTFLFTFEDDGVYDMS